MALFPDLAEVLDPYIDIPIRGKVYRLLQPSGEVGLRAMQAVTVGERLARGEEVDKKEVEEAGEVDLEEMFDPTVLDQMRTDGVRQGEIAHIAMTILIWIRHGISEALLFYRSGGDEEKAGALAREKRAALLAAANTTRRQGSTNGTSQRRATSPRRGRARKSRGTRS